MVGEEVDPPKFGLANKKNLFVSSFLKACDKGASILEACLRRERHVSYANAESSLGERTDSLDSAVDLFFETANSGARALIGPCHFGLASGLACIRVDG